MRAAFLSAAIVLTVGAHAEAKKAKVTTGKRRTDPASRPRDELDDLLDAATHDAHAASDEAERRVAEALADLDAARRRGDTREVSRLELVLDVLRGTLPFTRHLRPFVAEPKQTDTRVKGDFPVNVATPHDG
jgi:hypothetical protein